MSGRLHDEELAHHEAGHAVVSTVLGFPPDYVTIIKDGKAAGASGHEGGYKMPKAPPPMDQMIVSYAGYAAHIKYAPGAEERALVGASDDFENAERAMCRLRLSPGEPEALIEHKRAEAARLVEVNWRAIQRVAGALQIEQVIDTARLEELIAQGD